MERIAICDANQDSMHTLRRQIETFAKRARIETSIVEYKNGLSLLFDWDDTEKQADILYLDSQMPEISGIEIAEKLRKLGCNTEIIFYTKSRPEVFDAFDVDAFHYILKGETSVEKQEKIFRRAVEKSQEIVEELITFRYAGEHRTIKRNDIKYFNVNLRVLTIHYGEDKRFDFNGSLDKMTELLAGKSFIKINRQTLINMDYVAKRTRANVIMKDGTIFPIGKRYRVMAEKRLAHYFGDVGV
jgi:DNA-binding LytR/AlgR family response regulator